MTSARTDFVKPVQLIDGKISNITRQMNTQEDIQITTNDSVEDCADAVLQPKGLKVTKKLINVGTRKRVTQSTASL